MSEVLGNRKFMAWIVALVSVVTFFANNGVFVPDIMESRNIVTAREMVYDGHWMIPTMNGDLRLEKPPLPTWITAVAEAASPDNVPLMRGMAGIAALLFCLFIYRFSDKVLKINPVVSTLFFVTCYNVILMGRTASWDIYTHAFMMGGIYFLARGLLEREGAMWRFLWGGVFTGLSIMSKGPVSLFALFLPFLIAFAIVFCRGGMQGKWRGVLLFALVALAVGSWWYIYIYVFHSEALQSVVSKESGSWMNRNVRPWYYYWKFFLETGVWSLLLPTALFMPLYTKWSSERPAWLFSVIWLLAAVILLSCMPEKKTRYLLPILVPASYVMAALLERWHSDFRHRTASPASKTLFRINTWLVGFAVLTVPVAAWIFLVAKGYMSTGWFVALCAVCAICGFGLLRAGWFYKSLQLPGIVTAFFLMVEIFFLPFARPLINNPDMRSIGLTRQVKELDGIPFYYNASEPLRIELVYAAHRNIRPLHTTADSVVAHLPMAYVSHRGASVELPKEVFQKADTVYIGLYDDNRRPKASGRYNQDFVYHVTLLKPKKQ